MGRTREAKALIRELERRIIISKKRKKKLTDYLIRIKRLKVQGQISEEQLLKIINEKLDEGRTIEEWIQHYDFYIRDCERKINRHRRKIRKTKLPVVILSFVFIAIVLSSIFIFDLSFTGLITQEEIPTNISEVITTATTQQQAILGQPVKWTQTISLDELGKTKIRLPLEATEISVNKISETYSEEINKTEVSPTEDSSPSQEEPLSSSEAKFSITGAVISETEGGFLTRFFRNLGRMTGFSVQEPIYLQEVEIDDLAIDYKIEYETPAPYAIEEDLEKGKRIKIIGPETIHYENVLAFTELGESLNIINPNKIKIKWIEDNSYINPSSIEDRDNNGIYDYIEWVAPELSNQTFEIIIITKADHLDSNKNFISDIYEEVRELDGTWSETISDGEYVRVTFEIPLDSSRDITLYPRVVSETPRIEVYEIDGTELIAEFTSLTSNDYNKVFLTNLIGTQDTFDLKILDGDIEIDYIVDPLGRIKPVSPDNISQWPTWTSGTCTNHYECVDEDTADGATTEIECDANIIYYDYFNTNASFSAGTNAIKNVTVYAVACIDSAKAIDFFECVNIGGTDYCGPDEVELTVCPTWTTYSNFWDNSPDSLSEWEAEEVNNMLIGVRAGTDCNPDIHVTQVYATVGYDTLIENPPFWYTPYANESNPLPASAVRHDVNWTDTPSTMSYAKLEVNATGTSCDTWGNVSEVGLSAGSEWANLTWIIVLRRFFPFDCTHFAVSLFVSTQKKAEQKIRE